MPTNQYGVAEFDQDPETASQIISLKNRQKLADAMMAQGQKPLQGKMVGRVYVPPSIFEGLGNLANDYVGREQQQGVEAGYKGLAERQSQARAESVAGLQRLRDGTPKQELFTDDYTAVPKEDQVKDAVAPGSNKQMTDAMMMSRLPEFKKAGLSMLATQQKTPESPWAKIDPKDYTPESLKLFAGSKNPAELVRSNKPVYENATPLARLRSERAEMIAANPKDPGIKEYDDAITKETRTARQITPVIHIGQGEQETLTKEGQKVLDDLVRAGKPLPGGWSKSGQSRANASLNRIGAELSASGSTDTLPGIQGDYKSATAGHAAITKDLTSIEPFEKMLESNAKIAIDLGKKAIATDAKFANKPINWLKQNATDNPNVAEFLAQTAFVQTEAARVLNNPRLVGQLTDSARHEMQQVLSGDMPLNAYTRVVERVVSDGQRRISEMRKTQTNLYNQMNRRSSDKTTPSAATPAGGSLVSQIPTGEVTKNIGGVDYVQRDGQWFKKQ